MAEKQVHPGEVWRRKSDGRLVRVERVMPWYTEYDVVYRNEHNRRTGVIWQFNFLAKYERVSP